MLETIRENGEILACLEWYIVNWDGSWNDKGEVVWIEELQVSKSAEKKGLIMEFIKLIYKQVPWVKAGYFKRKKYNERVKLYSVNQWLKLLKKEN